MIFLFQESNQAVIEKKFGTVLIKDKVLTRHQVGQLVIFMVNQVQQLWDAPPEVLNAVDIVTGRNFHWKSQIQKNHSPLLKLLAFHIGQYTDIYISCEQL